MLDYYELLGVAAEASPEEIHSSYRRRIRTLHPDRFGADGGGLAMAHQMSGLLNLAWETLSRADARAAYDSRLRLEAVDHGQPSPPDDDARSGHDARLVDVLGDAVRRVGFRTEPGDQLTSLGRALGTAAQRYRAGSAELGDPARAMAVVCAFRDLVADGHGAPPDVHGLEQIAATALDLLGTPLPLRSGSWVERGVRPATPASPRRRAAAAVSRAGVGLVAVAAVATGVDVRAGHGTPWLPFVPDGVAPGSAAAAAATTLLIALALALTTLVGSRWLAAGGRPALAAEATVTVHLDAVDRIRFAAGRRFRTLPERQPAAERQSAFR